MTTVVGPRRKAGRIDAQEAERRRAALLQASLEEFLTHGFAHANLDRIAARCGISKMTIYRQIGSKQDLFLLTCESATRSLKPAYQAIVDEGGEPEHVVARLVATCQATSAGEALLLLRLGIGEFQRFPEIAARLLERTQDLLQPVADYIAASDCRNPPPEQAMRQAMMLVALVTGGLVKLLGSPEPDTAAWAAEAQSIFMAGMQLR